MLAIPRLLHESVVRRVTHPTRRVTINPAPLDPFAMNPGLVNSLLLSVGTLAPSGPAQLKSCTTDCEACDSSCRRQCQQVCCDRGEHDCTYTNFTVGCCSGQRPDCCAGRCVSFQYDESNCGRCGHVCPAGWRCCGGACINPVTDSNNCGTCGATCPVGAACVNGMCTCPAGTTYCSGRCTDLSTDSANCGRCGASCGTASCINGTCGPTPCDNRLLSDCVGNVALLCSRDPDYRSCVVESTADCHREFGCPGNQYCSPGAPGGICCPIGRTNCSGVCRALLSDPVNCGACGHACAPGEVCCNGACSNLATDLNNCGACGRGCVGGVCQNGTCGCPAGLIDCGGTCVNLADNTQHCGGCNNSCPDPAMTCQNGACLCPPGRTNCAGTCCVPGSVCCGGTCCPSGVCCGGTCCGAGSVCCTASDGSAVCGGPCPSGRCCPPPYPNCRVLPGGAEFCSLI